MMNTIDLNCDMGEQPSGQGSNFDQEIMPYITSCNVACGFHSGTPAIIERTIRAALEHNVNIGAHPSYNDREHFGRKSIKFNLPILISELRYQICAVKGMVESLGGRLNHVKPHGALYNDMVGDPILVTEVVRLIKSIDPSLKVYALAHSQIIDICTAEGIQSVNEGFADRRYQTQKQLRSRTLDGAVIQAPKVVLEQVGNFINGKVILHSGESVNLNVDSICLHSDTEGAVQLSKEVYQFLKDKNSIIG